MRLCKAKGNICGCLTRGVELDNSYPLIIVVEAVQVNTLHNMACIGVGWLN